MKKIIALLFTTLFLFAQNDTAMIDAVRAKDYKTIEKMLKNGYKSSKAKGGITPLYLALNEKDIDTVKFLIQKGEDVNVIFSVSDSFQISYLELAADFETNDALELLLKNKANIKGLNGFLALKRCIFKNRFKKLKWLLKHGVNINFQDKTKNTISHFLALNPAMSYLETLKDMYNQKIKGVPKKYYEIMQEDIKTCENNAKNYTLIIKEILRQKPNLKQKNNNGETPIDIAKKLNNQEFLNR